MPRRLLQLYSRSSDATFEDTITLPIYLMKLVSSTNKDLFVQMEHNDPNIYAPLLLNCMLMQFNLNSC